VNDVAQIGLEPVTRETLNDRVYAELKKAIIAGRFEPGSVMSIRSLSAALGTSAMPVRDAVRRLATEQALEMLPNRSLKLPRMTAERFDEIRQVRVILEGFAMEEMARRANSKIIAELDAINRAMRSSSAKPPEFLLENQKFHFTIYRASQNRVILPMIESLWMQIGPMLHLVINELGIKASTKWHNAIVSALRADEPKAARAALESDINDAAMLILDYIQANAVAKGSRPPIRTGQT